ncbi:MAG TPA: glycosyltransferase family 4 protein [Patescibacteria group bacterium]|nr:glycosyltransferase family 4 protein [Patescibacteria group bacterium]
MNILILNWRDIKHPLAGGAETMLWNHALFWQKKGSTITWISSQFLGAKKEEILEGITVKRFGSQYSVHMWVLLYAIRGEFSSADVVIDCFHFLPFFTPIFFNRKKIIAVIHEVAGKVWFDNIIFPLALIGYITEPFFFFLYKQVTFITVSNSTKLDIMKMNIPECNIFVVHNGVSVPKIHINIVKTIFPSILFLNRISLDKGIEDALVAFKMVKKNNPHLQFFIAGKEEKKHFTKILLKKYSLRESIKYLGFVDEKIKWLLLQKSWILIHPSKKEGWGLTVIEANSVGTPVIGYNVEGLRDSIRDNKTGLLVDPNPQALANAMDILINNKKMLRTLSRAAKDWSDQFTWSKSVLESWEIIEDVYKKSL